MLWPTSVFQYIFSKRKIWADETEKRSRPWCKEGVCWTRCERLKLEGWQASRSLEEKTFWSKWGCRWDEISRNRLGWRLIHHHVFFLSTWCRAGRTRSFLNVLHLRHCQLRFLHTTGAAKQLNSKLLKSFTSLVCRVCHWTAHLWDSMMDSVIDCFCVS